VSSEAVPVASQYAMPEEQSETGRNICHHGARGLYHDRGISSLLIDDSNVYLFRFLSRLLCKYCDNLSRAAGSKLPQLTVLAADLFIWMI